MMFCGFGHLHLANIYCLTIDPLWSSFSYIEVSVANFEIKKGNFKIWNLSDKINRTSFPCFIDYSFIGPYL